MQEVWSSNLHSSTLMFPQVAGPKRSPARLLGPDLGDQFAKTDPSKELTFPQVTGMAGGPRPTLGASLASRQAIPPPNCRRGTAGYHPGYHRARSLNQNARRAFDLQEPVLGDRVHEHRNDSRRQQRPHKPPLDHRRIAQRVTQIPTARQTRSATVPQPGRDPTGQRHATGVQPALQQNDLVPGAISVPNASSRPAGTSPSALEVSGRAVPGYPARDGTSAASAARRSVIASPGAPCDALCRTLAAEPGHHLVRSVRKQMPLVVKGFERLVGADRIPGSSALVGTEPGGDAEATRHVQPLRVKTEEEQPSMAATSSPAGRCWSAPSSTTRATSHASTRTTGTGGCCTGCG